MKTRSLLTLATAVATVLLLPAPNALAFKWHTCPPPPPPLNPSVLGATQSPFIHAGYQLRIVLNAGELARTGGFSLAPGGNTVEVTFASLYGDPVVLSPRPVSAIGADVLAFPFPDSLAEVGRTLAGPVEVRVHEGDRQIAWIASDDLVALPPTNDIANLLLASRPVEIVRAALSSRGDVWIPLHFEGDPGMSMPGCEGTFLLPAPIVVGAAETDRVVANGVDPFRRVRRVEGYLGDMLINDTTFYGLHYPEKIRLVHLPGTLGVSVCRLNDATDLVLRVRGSRAWARSRRSPMRVAVLGSEPLRLRLRAADPLPGRGPLVEGAIDSFGNACSRAARTPTHP